MTLILGFSFSVCCGATRLHCFACWVMHEIFESEKVFILAIFGCYTAVGGAHLLFSVFFRAGFGGVGV